MRCMGQGVTVELPHSLVSRRVNDGLNGFLPLLLSLLEIGLPLLPCVKVHRDNVDLKVQGLPLKARKEPISFSCAMGCAGTPGLLNALFDSAWVAGTKEEKVSVRVGGDGD